MDQELIKLSNTFKKYNLGCGTLLYEGYLNVGYWESLQAGAIYKDLNDTQNTYMLNHCLLYTSPSPRDGLLSRMPSSA